MKKWSQRASSLSDLQKKNRMEWLLFLKIYMGICGTCCRSMPTTHFSDGTIKTFQRIETWRNSQNQPEPIKRALKRGLYDRESIYQILDEALICHVGFVEAEQPYVIPINFARVEDMILCMEPTPAA